MANPYFGALGDVWKHLALTEILRLNPPRHYWETHAGSADYVLSESPARIHGAMRFLARAPSDSELAGCSYLAALQANPGTYPGSASLAMRELSFAADYLFCEIAPASAQSLRRAGSHLGIRVVEEDGVSAVHRETAAAAPRPANVLVHIDPFEPLERATSDSMTSVELAAHLAQRGYRLFYWYGYDSLDERAWAREAIARLAPDAPLWCGDVTIPSPFVYPERSGVWGCGIVLANMTAADARVCARLGLALERISVDDVLPDNDPSRLAFAVIE